MIGITVNGKPRQLERPIPLQEFLAANDIDPHVQRLAVAHNGEVLRRDEYDRVVLREGDVLELVRMVGGG